MHDPRRHRALAKIAAIRDAQCMVARQELFEANRREAEAETERRRALDDVARAASAWEDHLTGAFQPELARGLAGALMQRVDVSTAAASERREAQHAREESEAAWRQGDARCRQAAKVLEKSKRARARDREEQMLAALADRVSFAWSRS